MFFVKTDESSTENWVTPPGILAGRKLASSPGLIRGASLLQFKAKKPSIPNVIGMAVDKYDMACY